MKNIYTTSATMNYLMYREKMTLKDIRILLGERLATVKMFLKGKKHFSKQNYLDIISKFPELTGAIEYYENVKK